MTMMTRREVIGVTAAAVGNSSLLHAAADPAPSEKAKRTAWMAGHWGMMCHWIAPGPAPEKGEPITDLNRAVDAFQLSHFLEQFQASGASYLILTIGQNSACYASPNKTLDRLAGPGHASRRDLILEIATGVHKLGKRFIAYLPGEIKAPEALHKAFAWNPADQSEFERRYTSFVREYSLRFGKLIDAWWFDGCYTWPDFPNKVRHWQMWIDAARTGNASRPVAFNDGALLQGVIEPTTPLEDYYSGECDGFRDGKVILGRADKTSLILPKGRFVEGTDIQFHVMTPVDCGGEWAHEEPGPMLPPRFTDAELFPPVLHTLKVGGMVTLNTGISQEGHLGAQSVAQLKRLSRMV
jgi:hypothetical protein